MTYSYFPGCTLKNKAVALDVCARRSLRVLGVELAEIPQWQCCGGAYPLSQDEIATRLASVRALQYAAKANQPLVTLCAACHNVLKQVNNDMAENAYIASRVNAYLDDEAYHGEAQVLHYLELLRDVVGFDKIKEAVVHPFTGVKIGAYYGCPLLRPGRVMQMDNPENPRIMEDFIRAIGGESVIWGMRNECCGSYITLEDKAAAQRLAGSVTANAKNMGVDITITACPLCQYNLQKNSPDSSLPVRYFTELLAEALGVKEAD